MAKPGNGKKNDGYRGREGRWVGEWQWRDLFLTRFGAVIVGAWKEGEFWWVEDKKGNWVSKGLGINGG